MATVKNKLPTFGTNAKIDDNIVSNESSLKDTGFQPNTTIKSTEMNTYMKMLVNGMSGLIDSVYNSGVSQGEIKATSSADEVKNYIVAGLNEIIKTNKVDNATHADKATNVDNIVNNDNEDNANVEFSIGDKSFSKTVNDVANSKACSGNAASASKLKTARTININGDAIGTAQSFDGTSNITISVDVKKSEALDSTNVGDATHPVYFDAEGKPTEVNQKIANDTSGKADTSGIADEAIKLQNPRNITLTGDATGSASFDGSEDASITVDVNTASSLESKNVGSSTNPVYFDEDGKPQATGSSLAKSITGNAHTATKLEASRNIGLTGDVTGNADFDGSTNINLNTTLNPYKIYRSAMFNADGEVDLSQDGGLYFKKFKHGTGDVLELGHIGYGSVVLFAYQESASVVVMFTPHITIPWQGSSWQYPGGVNVSQYIYLYGHSYLHEYILTIQKDDNHSQYDNPIELHQRLIGSTSTTWTTIDSFTVYYAVIGIFQ